MSLVYRRAAFIAYAPGGYPSKVSVLPFRFNPESLSRVLSTEQGERGRGIAGAKRSRGDREQGADASSGALTQTFSVKVRFDLADRHEASKALSAGLGISPELAALESLMYPAASEAAHKDDGSEPVKQRAQRPTVLFVWGPKRVWPVRVTGMTVNETVFNTLLNPVRAEVDVDLEVLGDADAKDNSMVSSALDFMTEQRRRLAQMFLANTASQTTDLPEGFG